MIYPILEAFAMQSMSFSAQDTHPVANNSANSSAMHTLVYRGVTYQGPQQQVNRTVQAQARLAQLVGKRLIYRGVTYEIGSALVSEAIAPKTMQRLIYRGETYLKAV
jgi:Domain of unknown function (DUF4278)